MIGLSYITQSKKRLISVEQLGKSGGEGSVYLCNNGFAIKVFNEKADIELKSKKIDSLISKKIFDKTFALPIEKVFLENGEFQGFLMNTAQGETMQSCVFSRNGLLKKFPSWERINLANLAITLLKKLQILHNNKIIVGDINPYNIMVKSDTELFFIDTDSFQVDDFLCTVGTDLFTAPELQGADFKKTIRNIYNEQFSVATLLFMIFLPGKNPFAYTGGGDLAKNIKDQNFSYPLGEDD
ncbi:MAG TPA: hypothetical protein VHZ50_18785, partial [Puia sp.]|nr:hypothetical protein [Puia sp.]